MAQRKKVLALDIDGTLTNSRKEITPATKARLFQAMEEGHRVVLASGRPTPGMNRCRQELELDRFGGYLLSFNGARVVECATGEVVWQKTLPLSLLPELYEFAKTEGCGLATHNSERVISAFPPDEYVALEARMNGMPLEQVGDFVGFVDFPVCKCFMTQDPDRAAVLVQKLQEKMGDKAAIYRSDPFFIEIVAQNVDKAASLEGLLKRLGAGWEDTVCCGDGFNVISMIKCAGVGVAMGNAQTPVKEAADYVAGTCDQDGLVEVIDRFVLSGMAGSSV